MQNRNLKTTLDYLMAGRIIEAIQESKGWKNKNEDNIVYILHTKIYNFLFDRAFHKLPANYRYKLISKLNHKTHFTDGVSKSYAIECYYLNHDAFEEDGMIRGLEGGSVNMTTEMKAYYNAIDETVSEIADNKILLKDLIYNVAKPLSKIFYERLEMISNELGLEDDVKDDIYVAAPIPYKEYKFGNHATVKCFEPEIAFGMEIHGVRDSLKPINEYISEIKMFIDAYKQGFGKDDVAQNTTETKQEISKTSTIERLMCIAMLEIDTKKLFDLGFYGHDIKQAIDYATEYLRTNKTNNSIEVIVTDIKWDVDDKEDLNSLPKEVKYDFERTEFDCSDDKLQEEIEIIVSEKLSDDYGYCHDGFCITINKQKLIKELRHISRNWSEMNLNDDITDYPFPGQSFDDVISDIDSQPYSHIKEIHEKITNWIESL